MVNASYRFRQISIVLTVLTTFFLVTACSRVPEQSSGQENAQQGATKVFVNPNMQGDSKIAQYQGQVPYPPDIQRIKQRGKLIVAMYKDDRPPFFYTDKNGEFKGIDVKLASDIAKWMGVGVEFERSADSFDGVIDKVITGQTDIAISKLSVTLGRAQRAAFTNSYVTFHQTLLVNRLKLTALQSQNPHKNLQELLLNTGEKIGVRKATSYVDYAGQTFPNAQIVQIDGPDGIMNAAYNGQVLAALYDENEIKTYMLSHPDQAIYLQVFVLQDRVDSIAMAVAPGDQHLLTWLNHYLEQMKRDLFIDQLLHKYSEELK